MTQHATPMGFKDMAQIFFRTGMRSFGGWSTTALLLEKELTSQRKDLTKHQLHGAVTYAQILPGATQVAIVSNVGYKLRGVPGALFATVCYLLPSTVLMALFAFAYFQYGHGAELMSHMGGLIAALGGIIFANAYHIGKRHVTHWTLWALVAVAFAAKLWLDINAVIIILVFGLAGLLLSWIHFRRQQS